MEAHRTQSPHLPPAQTPPVGKSAPHSRRGLVCRAIECVSWCKDHIVSVAVLLTVPAAIGFYYGTRPPAAPAPLPSPYRSDRIQQSQTSPPLRFPVERSLAKSVATGLPADSDEAGSLVFAIASEEEDAVPPMPIAVDHPKPISRANDGPAPVWPGHAVPKLSPMNSATQCVWLTGSIEPEDTMPHIIQNASRVHELTSRAKSP